MPHLIAAVTMTEDATYARDVLLARSNLRTDARLRTAIARARSLLDDVLTHYPDLRDHPRFTTVHNADRTSG